MQVGQALCTGSEYVLHHCKLKVAPLVGALPTCHIQSTEQRRKKVTERVKVIGIICNIIAIRHGNRLESKRINMWWEYDRTILEGREDVA